MPTKDRRSDVAANIWTARAIPFVLIAVMGYSTYVLVDLCVYYLLAQHHDNVAAIPILVVHFLLLFLMLASFLRLLHITFFDPPLLPLGPTAAQNRGQPKLKTTTHFELDNISGGEYDAGISSGATSTESANVRDHPDSPGLELFYTKDIFECEIDGKPKWCSHCANWKPDRTHHCSMNGRCILKMDHFCPWVGGPLGETNIKFFIQFNWYTMLYCINLLVVMSIYVRKQKVTEGESVNPQYAVILALGGFFASFTGGMFSVSFYGALKNMTQVEDLAKSTKIHTMAVLKPTFEEVLRVNPEWTANPSYRYPEITYPLERQTSSRSGGEESARDQLAKRTFSVLQMPLHDNPWDLGSPIKNLRTVLGHHFWDWILPLRRSPRNTDDSRSLFPLGPDLDRTMDKLYYRRE